VKSPHKVIRVLGIDTSLRSSGIGVVEARGGSFKCIYQSALKVPQKHHLSECLFRIYNGVDDVIGKTSPDVVAIEGVFFFKNAKTAFSLGEARGAAIAACVKHGLPIYEYAPRRVKQAMVGFGGAEKQQVRKMVMKLLGLADEPQEDAGDALAIAICHLHSCTGFSALMSKAI